MKAKEDKVDFILGITYINVTKDELMELEHLIGMCGKIRKRNKL